MKWKRKKSHPYMPRARRWASVNRARNKSMVNVIDKEDFTFPCKFVLF